MNRVFAVLLGAAAASALAPTSACAPIVGSPLSEAPINACGASQAACSTYDVEDVAAKSHCSRWSIGTSTGAFDRCDFGRPDYPYTVIVDVPDSSSYAAGRTFVLTSDDLTPQPGVIVRSSCALPECVQLPEIAPGEGKYRVTKAVSETLGYPLEEGTSIPVRVWFVPLAPGTNTEAATLGLPLDDVVTASRLIQKGRELPFEISYLEGLAVGRYVRIAYPEPPYDAFFPPVFAPLFRVSESFLDDFLLGDPATAPLDDETGETRKTTIQRRAGLDGWHAWLADLDTGRRISSLKTLSGESSEVTLHTVGQSQTDPPSSSLRDRVEVIVAPPDGWLGVPRLETQIINGGPEGFRQLEVFAVPAPASFKGVVAQGEGETLTGIAAQVRFASTALADADGTARTTLKYTTTVSTDDSGRFATVLPPGLYDVTIEPAEGTGFAKTRMPLDTTATLAKTFRPPVRSLASGRATLADGRALSEADVLALPSLQISTASSVKPRPARARTDRDGTFRLELDPGSYDLVVDPQSGTGFPRVVESREVSLGTTDLGVIVVSPPARLAFTLRDPTQVGNPIGRALVRVFATASDRGPPAVEIGHGMTNAAGEVEILLTQQVR